MPAAEIPHMTERQLLDAVRDLARRLGWLTYHTHRSDRSEAGFPDLVLVHRERPWLVFAELKVGRKQPTAAQREWIGALDSVSGWYVPEQPFAVLVWRDTDWRDGTIERVLREGP